MRIEDTANIVPTKHTLPALSNAPTHYFPVTSLQPGEKTPIPSYTPDAYRILVVEDDLSLAELEANVLTAQGYRVVVVHSGELAISTLSTFAPHLVVLDIQLTTTLTGWDVLQALQSTPNISVLVTTSMPGVIREHLRNTEELPIHIDHLPKPYPMQTLLKRVKRMLMIA